MPPPFDSGYSPSFRETLRQAIAEFSTVGFKSVDQINHWVRQLRLVALQSMTPEHEVREGLQRFFASSYRSKIDRGTILRHHPEMKRFTLERIAPRLRPQVDRSISVSANLIRLNRQEMMERMTRRFSGWSSSILDGGSDAVDRREVFESIGGPLRSLSFQERRVMIDQGHKFAANLNRIIAEDGGAIAIKWHSNWRQLHYHYRQDHKERDGKIYLIRDSWAEKQGLVRKGDVGYYDEVTAVGEEIFCRCYGTWIYSIAKLAREDASMLTEKGLDLMTTRQAA